MFNLEHNGYVLVFFIKQLWLIRFLIEQLTSNQKAVGSILDDAAVFIISPKIFSKCKWFLPRYNN